MIMKGLSAFKHGEVFFELTGNISKSIPPILALKVFISNIDVDIQTSDESVYPRVAGSAAPT